MNYLEKIREAFGCADIDVDERVKNVNIHLSVAPSSLPNEAGLRGLISLFPEQDSVRAFLNDDSGSVYTITSNAPFDEETYVAFKSSLFADVPVSITFEITKGFKDGYLSVYCFEKFVNDILSLSICDVLTAFADLYEEQQHIYFKVYDREIFFKTGTMVFDSGTHSIKWTVLDRKNRLDKCREISCFYNQSQYPLLPDDFAVDVGSKKCKLNDLFSNICTNLSLAYLATTSSISENELRIQITGQRILDDVIPLRLQESNEEMYKIYSWVFVDGNPIDKILLARNTVSTHCRFTKITRLDGKTLASIQANYNLYLKKDVEQYIALTNVVAEHIQTSVNNIAECIDKLQNGIKGNLIAVLGFLLSTVLTSGISGRTLDDIFTKDIIAIMYFVLLGSLIYCAVTVSEIIAKQKRILRQYDEILKHYEKILSKEDICEIAGNGETINKAKSELKWEIIMWATVWIVFILIAFMAIDGLENGMHFFDYLLCFVRRVFLSIMRRVWNLIR